MTDIFCAFNKRGLLDTRGQNQGFLLDYSLLFKSDNAYLNLYWYNDGPEFCCYGFG